jgi:flagellar hook protein FlgE
MSFYTSLNGIKNAQTDLNVVSNNIANSETNGFKKSTVSFADVVAGTAFTNPRLIEGIGAKVEAITQNFKQGALDSTGSSLDLAISGDGFFTVVSPTTGQTMYTRNGAFQMDRAAISPMPRATGCRCIPPTRPVPPPAPHSRIRWCRSPTPPVRNSPA